MGLFGKLFRGPQVDMEKSDANAKRMRELFDRAVENGDQYRIIFGYTEAVGWFNYGFVHGSKTKIGNQTGALRDDPGILSPVKLCQ